VGEVGEGAAAAEVEGWGAPDEEEDDEGMWSETPEMRATRVDSGSSSELVSHGSSSAPSSSAWAATRVRLPALTLVGGFDEEEDGGAEVADEAWPDTERVRAVSRLDELRRWWLARKPGGGGDDEAGSVWLDEGERVGSGGACGELRDHSGIAGRSACLERPVVERGGGARVRGRRRGRRGGATSIALSSRQTASRAHPCCSHCSRRLCPSGALP